ncbi:pyridoxamine 5'-phosphate oxidase family protein [Streptomyces buecherae]|uniref:DUF1918 domain-containing protein n=1 Tax=Streptomyces buecherae TaxID=2763006 RepID=A0A7H8N2A0_9ACTN|nr:pyridoxamine 5'-phosphate oxidase family protein [Streptomyces buecherae]QKW48624.1 DUF1918 domain-containing protein [Streptomyces buecherae]
MRAQLGDRLVIEAPATGAARREGEIVGLHHEDGTPPYEVRWSDTDEVSLVFPGPDAHVWHGGQDRQDALEPRLSGEEEPDRGEERQARVGEHGPGDIGRRVAAERVRQGLGREEVARRAGMAPEYLAYLEEQSAEPSVASLIRLADALGTTLVALRGGDIDLPPGLGHALRHPRLLELDPAECRARLSTHGVGRVAVSTPGGPAVVPVNYEVVDETIAFRTAPESAPARAVGREVAFEVDHVDAAMSQGWSVLVVGPARVVTEPEAVRRLIDDAHSRPWSGGEREMWVTIDPARITGRRITQADQ